MMSLNNLQANIREWSRVRGLDKANPRDQMLKLVEETGELAADLAKGRCPKDSLGDLGVVLTILCQQLDTSLEEVLTIAYEEIASRKGKTVNGVFIKESD